MTGTEVKKKRGRKPKTATATAFTPTFTMKGKERTYQTPIGELPSVTTILGIISEPWLTNWVLKVAREAAVESILKLRDAKALDSIDEDTLDDVIKEAGQSHLAIAKSATDIGSLIHGAIEFYYKESPWSSTEFSNILREFYGDKVADMFDDFYIILTTGGYTIAQSEQTVYDPDGYAGTLDLVLRKGSKYYIADIKTTKKDRFKNGIPHKYLMQLAAYRRAWLKMHGHALGLIDNDLDGLILRLDKEKTGQSEIIHIKNSQLNRAFVVFDNLKSVYHYFKEVI